MAISYEQVGWDTTTYVNPTNMNQMDDGILAACDGVDALETEIGTTDISSIGDGSVTGAISDLDSTKLDNSGDVTYTGRLTISTSSYGGPLIVKGNSNGSCIQAGIASGSSEGFLRLYKGDTAYYSQIRTNTNTTNRNIYLPDANGTIALTSDITTSEFSGSTTVAANTEATIGITITTPSGYTPIGVINFNVDNRLFSVAGARVVSTTIVQIRGYNNSSSSITATGTVTVLFMKS